MNDKITTNNFELREPLRTDWCHVVIVEKTTVTDLLLLLIFTEFVFFSPNYQSTLTFKNLIESVFMSHYGGFHGTNEDKTKKQKKREKGDTTEIRVFRREEH